MAEVKIKSKTLDDVKEYIKDIVSFDVDEDYYKDEEKLEKVVENYKEIYFFDDPTLRKFLKKLLEATEELAGEYNLLPEEQEEEEGEEEEKEEEEEEETEEETAEETEEETTEEENAGDESDEKKEESVKEDREVIKEGYKHLCDSANRFLDY